MAEKYVSPDRRYDLLSYELCARLGFCGSIKNGEPLHVDDFFPVEGKVAAEQFARWALEAEQGDGDRKVAYGAVQDLIDSIQTPEAAQHLKWLNPIRDLFVKHMGAEAVDVSELQPGHLIMKSWVEFHVDDLSGAEIQALIARHLAGMHASSPACSVHALGIEKLKQPDVTFWSAWVAEHLAAMGALKRLDAARGEIKSMRVADDFLGRGVGRLMLDHIVAEARHAGMTSLWLETGSAAAFAPALKLYETAGFTRCGPFDGYAEDPFSVFMTRGI